MRFRRLGLVVVDEQHRFGVAQRATLRGKGESPDVLVMTATPIPRTLALTLYGDLDVSVLDELPPGPEARRHGGARRGASARAIYEFLREQVAAGRQVYVVCPLVEESEAIDLRAATEMAERLQRSVFPELRVGLLHGRMSAADKERVMREFKDGRHPHPRLDDGHRGGHRRAERVRDADRARRALRAVAAPSAPRARGPRAVEELLHPAHRRRGRRTPRRRIAAMTETNDGFRIAEVDLSVRGPGEFFGTRQSGLPEFRVADLLRDGAVLEEARADAVAIVQRDPRLLEPEHRALRAALLARWRGKLDLASVG